MMHGAMNVKYVKLVYMRVFLRAMAYANAGL
jgi:hypothetical protein